ncbi:Barrel-sandwich domain of CusB or HlyD membrane-fusion [Desulforamulus putei DSM 12395]|uniref:Barrel-sandwich domain of CusB or HlyD membrane-fusion n=1 Tax=Desulforamulus putei DSM 12395 TaxID=1121429 RepID=A0A1M5CW02_9FIRM|nr:efflux RND transporter periplasmic adaptor subunit [Desulforamulus putei]SHF58925.1 Barrel-sandwich domain of CusB or HlyD membrane-fusion [Desulforamulus putei DSM 12395]
MKNQKIVISVVLTVLLIIGGGIASYYWYEMSHYITTDDARISAYTANVSPIISGKITSWNVSEGEYVKAGTTLGWQDTNAIATSASVNPSALNPIGSITVSKAEITAPISGQVIKNFVRVGQLVGTGQPIAVIADTSDLFVDVNIDETEISKINVGQLVDLKVDALPGKTFQGRVDEIGKATLSTFDILPMQSANGNFTKVTQRIPLKVRFPEINKLGLLPGMSVTVKIHIAE